MALLNEFMSGGEKKIKVHVSEIRRNERNFYAVVSENEEADVDNLAQILLQDGQDDNGVVYEDESPNDGKKYTLLAGERRWKAITKNYEAGLSDGMYEVKVVKRPADEIDEMMRIVRNNAQRNKTKEVRAAEVKAMEIIWNGLVARGEKPEGKKREWIGANIGLSPRRVQEYMTGEESDNHEEESEENEGGNVATPKKKKKKTELSSADLEYLKNLQDNLTESMGRKVKISKNLGITFYPQDLDDIASVLNCLGFNEDGTLQ